MDRYVQTFVRTFAQLALAALLAIQVPDVVDPDWVRNTAGALAVALIAALIGSVVAVLWLAARSPADSALGKALRSAAEKAAGILGALAINSGADLIAAEKLVIGGLVAVVLAFAVTYLSYVPAPESVPAPGA